MGDMTHYGLPSTSMLPTASLATPAAPQLPGFDVADDSFGPNSDSRKRARARLSCAECRRLKLKCSRGAWPCESCIRRGCEHLCPDGVMQATGRSSRAKDQREIESLRQRVAELEDTLRFQKPPPKGHSPQEVYKGSTTSNSPASIPIKQVSVDLIDTVGSLTIAQEGQSRFVGPSGASAFRLGDSDHSDSDNSDDDDDQSTVSSFHGPPLTFPFVSSKRTWAHLIDARPSREHAEALSEIYFNSVSLWYEPVQKNVYYRLHLNAAYTTFGPPVHKNNGSNTHIKHIDVQRLAVVYAVLALGALHDIDAVSPRLQEAKMYAKASQMCLSTSQFMIHPTVASVECLQLLATFAFSTSKQAAEMSWQICGMMMRSLSALGLHRDAESFKIAQPMLDQRRALFFDCLAFEHQQALILGRPYSLSSSHYDVRMPDGVGMRWNEPQSDGEDGTFHRTKWRFLQIMINVAEVGLATSLSYDSILAHDAEVHNFMRDLPPSLQPLAGKDEVPDGSPIPPKAFRRLCQQHGMSFLIVESLLNLHRRHYTHALVTSPEEPLLSPYADSVIVIVLEVCKTILDVLQDAHEHYPRMVKRNALVYLHCFGAGVCLAMLCIRASSSLLADHALQELEVAQKLLNSAASESVLAGELAPRLLSLQKQAIVAVSSAPQPFRRAQLTEEITNKLAAHGFVTPSPVHQPVNSFNNYMSPASHNPMMGLSQQDNALGSVVTPEAYSTAIHNQPDAWTAHAHVDAYPRFYAPSSVGDNHSSASGTPSSYAPYQPPLQDYLTHLLLPPHEPMSIDNLAGFGTGLYAQIMADSLGNQPPNQLRHDPGWG